LFNSGTGWPGFFQSVADDVPAILDRSHGMVCTETLCARWDYLLGHVFKDGPTPTSQRNCVNAESLAFTDAQELPSLADPATEPNFQSRIFSRQDKASSPLE
jgi:peptide-methionine (R)-S-oxide reductase